MPEKLDLDVLARSVTRDDPYTDGQPGLAYPFNFLRAFVGAIPPWGTDVNARDAMLADFLMKESVAAGAIATVGSRNAAFSWEITSDSKALREVTVDLLNSSNMGRGWEDLMMAVAFDYHSQDKGAFIETIRAEDNPESPLMGLQHLPARDCWSTGKLEEPVVYRDKAGKIHRLKWYQVYQLREAPMSHSIYSGLQFCALSRFLEQAQIHANITRFTKEKTGGRNTRAIHFVSNVAPGEIASALVKVQQEADNEALQHFLPPVVVPTLSDERPPVVSSIEMAGLPEGFKQSEDMNTYLTILSLCLLVDYQELAPLPAGNIGTGSQSETLDEKSRQKGSALWRKNVATMMGAILPDLVEFKYIETDLDEEKKEADNSKTRSEARSIMVKTGELDSEGSRALAVAQGDIPEEIADDVAARGEAEEEEEPDPFALPPAPQAPVPQESIPDGNEETKAVPVRSERMELEESSVAVVDATLQKVFRRIRRELRERETSPSG